MKSWQDFNSDSGTARTPGTWTYDSALRRDAAVVVFYEANRLSG